MWSLLTSWGGSLRREHLLLPHPTICITTLSLEGGWEIQALHLAFVMGVELVPPALPVVLLFESHNYCLEVCCPTRLPRSWSAAWEYRPFFSFSMSIDASGYLLPQPLIQDIRSAKKTQGKHHHVLPWPPESAASLLLSLASQSLPMSVFSMISRVLSSPWQEEWGEVHLLHLAWNRKLPNVYHLMIKEHETVVSVLKKTIHISLLFGLASVFPGTLFHQVLD